ncbi:unnamed protein product [Orchesella dallaii]|uniref:Uncharacterized protein n=1 Tax=Orchesella dallaii TaxID=48710 RepID=A0ABP1PY99_9HEXA
MKGLATLSIFAFLYLLIIIIFNEAAGEPRGVDDDKNIGQSSSTGKQPEQKVENIVNGTNLNNTKVPVAQQSNFGNVATEQQPAQKGKNPTNASSSSTEKVRAAADSKNDTNPLADLFQITDPTMRTAMGAVYGAYKGSDQCSRKAFCMMGNYMRDMPGRDVLFLFMGNYIPQEYSLSYAIFKAAVLYGQDCGVYVCVPEPADTNVSAATAARPNNPKSPNFNADTAPPR